MTSRIPQTHCAHVVVAVKMPAETPCEEGVPLFALGIAEVPWNGSLPEDTTPHDSGPYG